MLRNKNLHKTNQQRIPGKKPFIQSKEMLYGSLYCVSLGNGSGAYYRDSKSMLDVITGHSIDSTKKLAYLCFS